VFLLKSKLIVPSLYLPFKFLKKFEGEIPAKMNATATASYLAGSTRSSYGENMKFCTLKYLLQCKV
jgi:hypothetical protein